MFVRDDQDVGRRDRTSVAKGSDLVIAIHDRRFDFSGNDFAENT
jgi:hypothetical protein